MSGTNRFMTNCIIAVTTSYDLNKNGPLVVILLCNQVVTYPNGQYTYLGVVVLVMDYVMKIGFPHTII
jgi:hypothetical protein